MKKQYKSLIIFLWMIMMGVLPVMSQGAYDPSVFISTDINVGNPTYPFPQFLEYTGGGKTLAKYNAEGVTHADMEKTMREAYEIMMHRCRYMGGTHCGVQYITFNHDDVAGNYGTFVSEGDGYAMLAAAIFADQKTFNGLYMWVHDNRMSGVERFKDGSVLRAELSDYAGPYLAGWKNDETTTSMSPSHSATDGDVDIAMAMLVAYKQWGEWMMQDGAVVKDYAGNPISLKEEAYRVISALVDTMAQWDKGSGVISGYLSGDIGIDGYCKKGNSWGELTRWRFSDAANAQYPGMNGPYNGGPNLLSQYGTLWIDYDAPAYFDEFYRWFKDGDGGEGKESVDWQIHQFKRAAASGNYLNREAYKLGYIASIGNVTIGDLGENPAFNVYVDGEDFRYAWRHLVDYLWHGHQQYDWDPVTHQVIDGTNTSEYDMALRHAEMLKNPKNGSDVICSKMGASPDPGQPMWSGISQTPQQWTYNGGITSPYHTNYSVGSGAPAAVISEDMELLADVYRQCEIAWDGNNTNSILDPEERYIGSTPKYFHGWFRTLGMLVCSGNLIAPEKMVPAANMKVYMSVDKTYAYQGDEITYSVQYRNYGSKDAEGVTVVTELDPNYEFVSANKGGKLSGNKIVWNIGTVSGFKTGGLAATIDSMEFTVIAKDTLNPRICLTSTISGDNFEDWVSNEYPNHATYTMERNCVDILANRSLYIEKTANRTSLNPKDIVTFTVEFGNKSEGESSWMNGGRDNVRISYGNYMMDGAAYQFYQLYRFWNDSYEAYINMNNYRVSYFMNDAAAVGLYDASTNATGWTFVVDNQNDLDKYGYNPESGPITFSYQKIPVGSDENGKWNQRLMIRFADVLMAPTTHVYDKLDSDYLLHKGVRGPGFIRARLASNPNQDLTTRVQDDWSYSTDVKESTLDGQGTTFTLVSPCWANYDNPGYVIDNYSRHVCDPTSVKNFGRVLVEEFDGYTWRRVQGTGPLPGKEAYNVTIADTIPYELEWVGWKDSTALKNDAGEKIQATYTPSSNPKGDGYTGIVYWTVPQMLVGESDKLIYLCKARDLGCPDVEDTYYENAAWIWSDTDSPDSSKVDLMTTCAELPPVIEPQTSLFKSSSVAKAETGDAVSYELKFKNTEGTRVEADCSSQSGWIALGSGSVAAVGTDGLKLSTNGSSAYFFAPEKSYGKDGSVYLTIGGSPSSTQELYFVMRYVSGTPGSTDFKGVCIKLMVNKDGKNNFGYYLYNDATLIASEGLSWADAMQFPGDNTAPTFKFVLEGDHLYMYINDQEDEWINVLKDWEGLTSAGPGYFGMYVNSNGNSSTVLSSFITELDYAFDITLYDDLPDELGNITNISDGGTWDESKNYITWPTIATTTATALAPNDSIIYTFDAEVVSCKNYINNYGLATVYGMDTLKVLNTVECGAAECSLTDVELALDEDSICDGTIAYLTATAKPTGSYTYEFFKDGVSMGTATTTKTMPVTEEADYTVLVTSSTDATCSMESDPIKLIVSSIPTPVDYDLKTFCPGKADLTIVNMAITVAILDGNTFNWYDEDGNALTGLPDINSIKDAGVYKYQYTVLSKHNCLSDTAELIFTVGDTAIVDLGPDLTLCPGGSATLDAGAGTGYTYLWDDSSKSQTLEVTAAGDYTVTVTTGTGCEATDEVTVTVASELKVDLGKDTTICSGSSLTLDAGTGYDSYAWTDGETTQTLEVTTAGTYDVSVTQGSCSGSGSIEVSVSTASAPTGTFAVSYIVGDTASDGTFDQKLTERDITVVDIETGYTYNWYDENKVLLTEEPIPAVPAGGGNATYTYYVSRTNADGCESELKEITVSVSGAPTPTVEDVYYCVGETATALTATATDDGSNTTWTLNWYDAEGTKLSTEADRTPSTATASEVTYYVSQESAVGAESGKVPVKVTTYEVGTPDTTGNQLSYCASADAIAVGLTASTTGSTTGTTQSGTLVWSVDNVTTTGTPQVNLNVAANTTTTYGVKSEYEISAGHTCSSKEVTFNVTVTYVGVPSGDMTVSYVKTEAVNGTFASLTDKNSSVATAEAGNELVWYDSDGNLIGTTAPSPESDASWASDSDVTLTYYVTQRNVATGCESEKSKVTVVISNMPMPKVSPVGYCQGETAQQLEAEKDESDGGSYVLVWYDPETGAELTSAPTPETTTPGETIYKVAQRNSSTSATSTASELKVTVYEKPVLAVTTPSAQCGGSVDLSEVITLTNAVTVTRGYYTDAAGSTAGTQLVSTSGTYYSDAYYPVINSVTGKDCRSELQNVEVEINDLSNLQISGPSTVCPGGDATLKATATSTDPGTVDYLWSDEASGTASTYEAKALTGSYGTVHTYTVTASAGACTGSEALKKSFTVTIDKGLLDGSMTIDGVSKDKTTTCGIETVALGTTHQGTDYEWYDMLGGKLGDGSSLSVTPTLTTSYELRLTNVCEARDTVTVEVKQLNVSADWTQFANEVCEGESAKVTLTITGYDSKESGSYIKWYKDNNELTQYAGQSELNFSAAEVSQSGTYHYAVSNGICEMPEIAGSDAGTLTVKAYVKYDTPATQEVVRGETAILSITNLNPSDADVTWTSSEANGTGNPYTLISADKDQLFDVTMSSTGYCSSTTQLQVLVDAKIAIAVGSDKTQICQGDAVTLKADTAGTGRILHPENYQIKWYGCDQTGNCREITGANSIQLQQQPQSTTSYYVSASYGTQKVESDKEEIEVIEPATYTKSEGTVSCSGDAVTISVQANESDAVVTWADDLTAGATREVSPTTDTDYTFTITRTGGCKQTNKLSVEVKSKPEVTTEANVSVCEGTSITLKSTVTGDEITSYIWTNASGETVSQEAMATITPEMTEPYTITVGTESCGEASSTIDVNVTEVPEVGLDSLGINSRRIIVLSGGSGNFEYKMDSQDWSTEDTYEHLLYAMHVAQVKDGSGCIGSTIFSLTAPAITIPDYFSPDSNGENDVWDVANIFDIYSDATIKIYDRTGKQLVELSGDTTEWDGLYNGNKMPSTDYWYVIDIPQIDKQYTGHFTLIRR